VEWKKHTVIVLFETNEEQPGLKAMSFCLQPGAHLGSVHEQHDLIGLMREMRRKREGGGGVESYSEGLRGMPAWKK